MKTLYGPVPSRRLGLSLGIDPFERKTCTHNCIYCQLGYAPSVASDISIDGVSPETVEEELADFFNSGGKADYITFSGSGEPTLWKHIGRLCKFIKENFSHIKLAVITNGTTLWRNDVRSAIGIADVVVPTISASSEKIYKILHRPNKNATFEQYIQGISKFAQNYSGEIWAEVMLVDGVNDGDDNVLELSNLLKDMPIKYIDLNLPVRPPAEKWVHPPQKAKVENICKKFGKKCRIVGKFTSHSHYVANIVDLSENILKILSRRPETAEGLSAALGKSSEEITLSLNALVDKKIIIPLENGYFKIRNE